MVIGRATFVGGVLVGGGKRACPIGRAELGGRGIAAGGAWWAGRVTCCPAQGGASGARSRAGAPEWLSGGYPPAIRGIGGPRVAGQVGLGVRLVRAGRGAEAGRVQGVLTVTPDPSAGSRPGPAPGRGLSSDAALVPGDPLRGLEALPAGLDPSLLPASDF